MFYEFIFFAVGIILGFTLGVIVGRFAKKNNVENWQQRVILTVVTMLYSLSILKGISEPTYSTPYLLHVIAGFVFGHYFEINFEKFIGKLTKK